MNPVLLASPVVTGFPTTSFLISTPLATIYMREVPLNVPLAEVIN